MLALGHDERTSSAVRTMGELIHFQLRRKKGKSGRKGLQGHILAIIWTSRGLDRVLGRSGRIADVQSFNQGIHPMRKIALIAAASAAALSLAACSESTQDAAESTAENAAADTEANLEAAGTELEQASDDIDAAAENAAADAEAATNEAEADMQDETVDEAAAD
ncbi:hypothetical protein [Qipengyuania spongiae]|uniref:Uncharacterized protein n=1 Tax=Qipengyuania spongiae TaxID=2909673 RepID=A0ABY5SZV7_9SPHN|nr:hypothetical protein [Qipengyuania spongiae]UVI39725.1 hypothetical protein L1F33_01820 [Qipengyuania spongiae]